MMNSDPCAMERAELMSVREESAIGTRLQRSHQSTSIKEMQDTGNIRCTAVGSTWKGSCDRHRLEKGNEGEERRQYLARSSQYDGKKQRDCDNNQSRATGRYSINPSPSRYYPNQTHGARTREGNGSVCTTERPASSFVRTPIGYRATGTRISEFPMTNETSPGELASAHDDHGGAYCLCA